MLFALLLSLFLSVNSLPSRPWRSSSEPVLKQQSNLVADTTRWYPDQTLDHFDGTNTKTWRQRWFVNETFWDGTGAVFLCVGGEGPAMQPTVVVTGDLHCADMVTLAPQHKALIVAVEHRYYGESYPTPDFSTANLKWLSSHQALADLAQIHAYISSLYNMTTQNRWVSWGGSYPGMLAGWFRLKYPHLVFAAVSSSAPVAAIANMQGYNDVVAQSMAATIVGGSTDCANLIQAAFTTIGQQLGTSNGRRGLEKQFNVCVTGMLDDVNNQRVFTEDLSELFPVQSNDPACTTTACNISACCNILLNPSNGATPIDRLATLSATINGHCLAPDYAAELRALGDTSLLSTDRLWFYQTCTEFAFYQTCDPGSQCIFTTDPHLNNLQSYYDQCTYAYGVSGTQTQNRVNFSNDVYGATQPGGSRILFVNGQIDPWHAQSVLQSVTPDEPALWVEGASHHYWTHPPQPTDTPQIVAARQAIFDQVNSWLLLPY